MPQKSLAASRSVRAPKRAIRPAGDDAAARDRIGVIISPRSAHCGKRKQEFAASEQEIYSVKIASLAERTEA
jgi:hypothetical protein